MKTSSAANLTLALAVSYGAPALALDYESVPLHSFGIGLQPCIVITKIRATEEAEKVNQALLIWSQGFISGINIGVSAATQGQAKPIPVPKDETFVELMVQECSNRQDGTSFMSIVTSMLAADAAKKGPQ